MTPETLSLLTARAAPLNTISRSGSSFGGHDLAASLSGLTHDAMALAMIRYVGDSSLMPQLAYQAWLRAVDVVNRDGWRPPRGTELVRKMTQVALYEAVERPVCGACHGTGHLGARQCHHCQGSGAETIRDVDVARALDMKRDTYCKTWKLRYESIRRDIGNWVTGLDGEVRYKIKSW